MSAQPQKQQQEPGLAQRALGALGKAVEVARAVSDSPGAAPVHAAFRQGADEVAQVLPAFPDSNIQPVAEPGQIFEPTPQLVTAQITGRDVEKDGGVHGKDQGGEKGKMSIKELLSHAKGKAKEAEQQMERGHEHGREGKEQQGREM